MGWLAGWLYRKKVTITGQSGAGTNYQVKLLIGAAAGGNVHLEGHCTNFPEDIVFTTDDGETKLPYWIEDKTADPLTVWVKVTDSLEVDVDIYIYYGKSGASTESNGANTFIQYHGAASANFKEAEISLGTQIRFRAKARVTGGSDNLVWGYSNYPLGGTGTDSVSIQSEHEFNIRVLNTKKAGTLTKVSEAPKFVTNTWYILDILYTTTAVHGYVNDDEIGAGSTTNLPTANMGIWMWENKGSGEQLWSFIGKYVSPEPAFDTAGAEEEFVCTEEATKCVGYDLYTCTDNAWILTEENSETCGFVCTEEATKCVGYDLYTCVENEWILTEENSATCGFVCTEEATKCVGYDLYTCVENEWTLTEENSATCGYVPPGEEGLSICIITVVDIIVLRSLRELLRLLIRKEKER